MDPILQGGLIGVEGSLEPTAVQKRECVEIISKYVMDGWAIATDPFTRIGLLAALTAETACVPFVNLTRLALGERALGTAHVWLIDRRLSPTAGAVGMFGTFCTGPSDLAVMGDYCEFRICASKATGTHNV